LASITDDRDGPTTTPKIRQLCDPPRSSQNIVETVQRSDPELAPLPVRSPFLELAIELERAPRTEIRPLEEAFSGGLQVHHPRARSISLLFEHHRPRNSIHTSSMKPNNVTRESTCTREHVKFDTNSRI